MKKVCLLIGLILLPLLGYVAFVMQRPDVGKTVLENTELELSTHNQTDQAVKAAALESPEEFHQLTATETIKAPVPLKVPTTRPKQLSEVEKPVRENVQKEPIAVESLYSWKNYESLRKDEIRNPNSKENREGVVSLMKARQRRVGQGE